MTYVGDELIGDPLDVKMFLSTEWIMEEPNIDPSQDEIILAYLRPKNSSSPEK